MYFIAYIVIIPFALLAISYLITFLDSEDDRYDMSMPKYVAISFLSMCWPISIIVGLIILIFYCLFFIAKAGNNLALKRLEIKEMAEKIYIDNKAGSTHLMSWKDCIKEAKKIVNQKTETNGL
jgi:hypothetical protein